MSSRPTSRLFPALAAFALVLASGQATAAGTPADPAAPATTPTPGVEPGAPPAEPTQVTRLRREHAYRFVVEGDGFRRAGRIDASSLQLPSPVVREARGTYVQIHSADGPVWLERMQLVLDRAKQVKADCPPGLSSVGDRMIAGTSGAGAGC